MSISFNKDDVHKHLLDLGYSNISGDQLQEFMKDLKRLIRYEEKQKRIEAHLNVTKGTSPKSPISENKEIEHLSVSKERQRHISADSSYSTSSSIFSEADDEPKKAKLLSRRRPKSGGLITRQKNNKPLPNSVFSSELKVNRSANQHLRIKSASSTPKKSVQT